jgi:hypothetical protein
MLCAFRNLLIALLKIAKQFVSQDTLLNMFNALVLPHFTYCSNVWNDGIVVHILKTYTNCVRLVHVWELPSLILQLDSQGGQEEPEIQETWMEPRQLTSSSPKKLLCYNFSIGALVTRQTKLYLGNVYFLIHLFFHSVLSVFEKTQYLWSNQLSIED